MFREMVQIGEECRTWTRKRRIAREARVGAACQVRGMSRFIIFAFTLPDSAHVHWGRPSLKDLSLMKSALIRATEKLPLELLKLASGRTKDLKERRVEDQIKVPQALLL